jgi:HEPN domain-containing protein
MNGNQQQARRWFDQAVRDADAARFNEEGGFFEVACFLAQQSAEKLLKALLHAHGQRLVFGHSTVALAEQCQEYGLDLGAALGICRRLDQFYIPTRYPNGLPDKTPADFFDQESAAQALGHLTRLMALVTPLLPWGLEQD